MRSLALALVSQELLGAASASVALCLEGGGWRAQSSDAGFVSGMLAYLAKKDQIEPRLSESGLLDRFDHFSTVSGSTWFFASMAYSEGYRSLLEAMAASPGNASALYNKRFTTPYLKATDVDPAWFDLKAKVARDVAARILGKGDEDSLFLAQYFLSTKFTWNEFTEVLLSSTAQIGPDVQLGSPVQEWAKDKTWLVVHSALFPTGTDKARLFQGDWTIPQASYVALNSSALPEVLPAKFSIRMGAGVDSSAPHEYVPATAVSGSVQLDFRSEVVPVLDSPHATSAPLDSRDFSGGAMTDSAGKLPVVGVASASSAAAGIAPALGLLAGEGLALVDGDLTPWVSNALDGSSFAQGAKLVSKLKTMNGVTGINHWSIKALADAQVHGLIDGGYTDDPGLAQAVAAGADEVLVLLNSNATNNPFHVAMMFKDGPAPDDPGASKDLYPVFSSPVGSEVESRFTQFHRLALPSNNFLKQLAVGSIQASTAQNAWFGIEAGRTVTINIINFCSSLGIGVGVDFTKYDKLIDEIMQALLAEENDSFVASTVLPMVLGQHVEADPVVV